MGTAAAQTHLITWKKNVTLKQTIPPSHTHTHTHTMITALQKILLDGTEHHQAIITFILISTVSPLLFFSSWMLVLVCEWWVNEDHFAVWADGEHWSACWQVAYSLLSELALSHTQRDTRKNTHLCTHTAAALSPNWYPEGFDGERARDRVG